ncbi:GNAT family N-acetyltransferase [Psychrobacter lutiphocae]|uniref:GNAT family N-acetyltransferase n=1 Tax=Psychrobacter lutiphocae TaxID=540500 RepID=UPI0003714049|nr:GNAT family N-acetyltransferase [Psychrobacter lutiphocae]
MIELAKIADAKDIANVIRESILSCVADHQNDPVAIEQWLANKTQSNVEQWISNNYALVYQYDEQIVGFILVSKKGEILLNYVKPESQGQGVGKQLLNRTKADYLQQGITRLTAESTLTAKPFYLANDFKVIKEVLENDQLVAYQMQSELNGYNT